MARTRTRNQNVVTNVYTFRNAGGTIVDQQTSLGYMSKEVCVDDLGPKTDHPLSLTLNLMRGSKFDWKGTYQGVGSIDASAAIPAVPGSGLAAWLGQFTAQKIVAATAPERPNVNVITNIYEFRDIPRMLRQAGDLLLNIRNWAINHMTRPQQLASANLAWQFGWAPLLQDLAKVWDFGKLVDDRLKLLGALNSGKTVNRRVKFGSFQESIRSGVTLHSILGITIQPSAYLARKVDCWATVRWSLRPGQALVRPPTWLDAFRSVYGLTFWDLPVQIWKALPWSWMIDWFANISDAMTVAKNMLFYAPSRINKMWFEATTCTYDPLNPFSNRFYAGGTLERTIKSRTQLSVGDASGIHLSVPFLDAFKLSILGSLTIVKLARR